MSLSFVVFALCNLFALSDALEKPPAPVFRVNNLVQSEKNQIPYSVQKLKRRPYLHNKSLKSRKIK